MRLLWKAIPGNHLWQFYSWLNICSRSNMSSSWFHAKCMTNSISPTVIPNYVYSSNFQLEHWKLNHHKLRSNAKLFWNPSCPTHSRAAEHSLFTCKILVINSDFHLFAYILLPIELNGKRFKQVLLYRFTAKRGPKRTQGNKLERNIKMHSSAAVMIVGQWFNKPIIHFTLHDYYPMSCLQSSRGLMDVLN